MSRVLVLDDDEIRHGAFARNLKGHDVVHVRTVEDAIATVKFYSRFDVFFLDHDLNDFREGGYGEIEMTGEDFARWMASHMDHSKRPELVWIHSWNVDGAKRMQAHIKNIIDTIMRFPWNEDTGRGLP